jgi:hypothetical protein
MEEDRNKRIHTLVSNRMRYMFREVLTTLEKESKSFNINSDFFKKTNGKPRGFYAVRKCMFDHGNDIVEVLGLILKEVEVTPKGAIVHLDRKVVAECGTEHTNESNN